MNLRRALTGRSYDVAVGVAMALVGVVEVEPSPVDLLFAALVLVALLTGRLGLGCAPRAVVVLVGVFLALNLLACPAAPDVGRAFGYLAVTTYLMVLGGWLSGYVDSASRARTVVRCYVGGAVAAAAAGTVAVLVRFPGSIHLTDSFGMRANALFKDANVFGPFLVVAAVLVLVELVEPSVLRWRTSVGVTALAVLTVGIIFSFSRGAWVNLAVTVVVIVATYVFGNRGSRRALAATGVALSVLGVGAVVVVATGTAPFLGERARGQSYDSDRFHAQRFGVELAGHHPLGVGPGQFEVLSPVSAHSIYVRALAEEGVVGFLVLVALLGVTLLLALRNMRAGVPALGISPRAVLAIWCGLLVNSLVVDTLHWRHLWIVAGLIWAAALARDHDTPARAAPWPATTDS